MSVISDVDAIRKSLKVVYKDGMGTLLGREGSAIKEIDFQKAEGKTYNFSAVAGRGGAVAGNYSQSLGLASDTGLQAEFSVGPGAIWASYVINKVDLAAAKSNLGAYAPILKREFYRATAGLRKTLSSALYGRGYGEFAIAPAAITVSSPSTEYSVALDPSATQKVDVGTKIVFKTHISDAEENALVSGKVTKLLPGMKGFVFEADKTGSITAGAIICVKGSTIPAPNGGPLLPIGLDAWFPIIEGRNPAGSVWPNFITQTFCGEDRSDSVDRMAGAFYAPASASEKIIDTIQGALLLNRSMGGDADMIIMNMFDRADLAKEIAVQNTYFSSTTSKATRKVNVGLEDFSVSSATNIVDLIVDDIDCPRYKFYVLTKSTLAMLIWMAKKNQNKDDGLSTNEPGKPDINDVDEFNFNDGVSKLDIDDYVTITDNVDTWRGPAVTVTLGFVGALAVFDPSANVVGYLPAAYGNEATKVLGWTL